ncbi:MULTISPECIES: 2-amino-4-hydroxy-6-hydroxymethyldihydropteridine diphosphokinase [Gammaproteobacteria]|uniref:2-amino-4-hydroxy-6- hydroxymethyldihydropteridine diphosphokinase n=1 Tax=Gammaproteobacteria TaxID=1236 RepID=UPI000DCFFFBB|nr:MULTISPECIES: 2-amino-4-hydroxy-6-hydroxymethyldihydropteridine diphosphokinase [Gammaproteobacteria]RTE87579.1 2-amino-4-hydroxy-6-hydroxymethyldihydropteridine diphosphokinase [Aliidiomarina sp. B3213]TCZ92637.1 2-amino-4-hydroxy-6-hydroxymethyldihydropteridine diphosphokinase [Lysobacter sp. N42]
MDWYYLSLGANIEPENHLQKAIETIIEKFGAAFLSPIVQTQPCNINTSNVFLNAVMIIRTDLAPDDLKAYFVELEEQEGRDRTDPLSSQKDRPLDIDILSVSDKLSVEPFTTSEEPYTRICIEAAQGAKANTHAISVLGHLTSDRAATIHFDHGGSHIFIVEDRPDSLLQNLETALCSK